VKCDGLLAHGLNMWRVFVVGQVTSDVLHVRVSVPRLYHPDRHLLRDCHPPLLLPASCWGAWQNSLWLELCLSMSFSVLFNEVFYIWATEYEGSIIKATTTIVVVALPSRSDIATVNRWRSCFSSCCRTSLECCLAWCHLSQLFVSFQMSAEDGALSAELSGSCSNCIWLIYD